MMIKFKGRSSFKQYIKEKPIKQGYKVWVLADASTGYVYNFEVYSGKSVKRQVPLGEHVVWSLTRGLSIKFHYVYFDNFFTSPFLVLVERLLENGIYYTGTLRANRRGIPSEIIPEMSSSDSGAGREICRKGFYWCINSNLKVITKTSFIETSFYIIR
jgi:hypothetical protein